ncbi:hypothetical protein KVQ90_24660, partial [Escherichia coli]|nr:hypothetical protein [Escherichia coli]
TSFLPGHDTRLRRRRRAAPAAASFRPVVASAGLGAEVGRQLVEAVGVGLPCTVMACGDVIYRSTLPHNDGLTITAPGVALALAAAFLHAFWNLVVARARDPEAATAVAYVVALVAYAPVAAA